MGFDLQSARHWAQSLMLQKLRPGMTAVDGTLGNGGDCEFLCRAVGASGRVIGFDVQRQAIDSTRARLEEAGLDGRATLILAGHERMGEYIKEPIDAALFNLGWLPGGDKRVTTHVSTTLAALSACLGLMRKGALLTVCAYPGHDEGKSERDAALQWARELDGTKYQSLLKTYLNQPAQTSLMLAVHKLRE